MTNDVTATSSTASDTIKKIGPALVIASILGSTLGIVVAQFLDDLGDGLLAQVLGGNAILFNNRVEFTGASDLAWAGGFLLCLIVGLLMLFTYPTARGHGVARLTLLWMLLHILRQAFLQAILLPIEPSSQLALAYRTLDAPPGLEVVIAAGGAVGLLLIALSAAAAFLTFTPHRRLISTGKRRFSLALWLGLVPAAISIFLAIPYFASGVSSGVIPALPLTALMFLATLAAAPGTTTVQGPEDQRETPMPWGLGATLAVIMLLEILIFRGGVSVNPILWG